MFRNLRRWFLRTFHGRSYEFIGFDGREIELDCVRCGHCTNYFYLENAHIEPPRCCPYCLSVFSRAEELSHAAMQEAQDSSH